MSEPKPTRYQLMALWCHCRDFIDAKEISCPETIAQTDRVIEGAYDFIEGVCDLVGYYDEDNA